MEKGCDENFGAQYTDPSEPQGYHILVSRDRWGAAPAKGPPSELRLPASNVRYTYTKTEKCETHEGCEKLVRSLQTNHMQRGCSDIMYNFLVGGDGRVYEGRGWGTEGHLAPHFPDLKGNVIDIAFIGTYGRGVVVCQEMVDWARGLVDWGTDYGKIKMPFTMKQWYEDDDESWVRTPAVRMDKPGWWSNKFAIMVRAEGRNRHPQWEMPAFRVQKPTKVKMRPLSMFTRAEWLAGPAQGYEEADRLLLPANHVRYTYTCTDECWGPEECIPLVRRLQTEAQEQGFPDIMYNFLIGSDGSMYEGRGWDYTVTMPGPPDPWVDSAGPSIRVGYIGTYKDVLVPWQMSHTGEHLRKWGAYHHLFTDEYEITPSILYPYPPTEGEGDDEEEAGDLSEENSDLEEHDMFVKDDDEVDLDKVEDLEEVLESPDDAEDRPVVISTR